MKRSSQELVAYSSSEDDEAPKKKKLPSLSRSLLLPLPPDCPALHQGRIRTKPHVEGQWAAHVFVSLSVERQSKLDKLIDDVFNDAKKISPTLTDFLSSERPFKKRELHISLSRPTYLRAHQREDLKRAVKDLSQKFVPFTGSFATFSEFFNDERTRTFLTMEVGAGHHELRAMSNALTPLLQIIRQQEFYSEPRFHASIAWALLENPLSSANPTWMQGTRSLLHAVIPTSEPVPEPDFPTIPHLPKSLVPYLNEQYGTKLSSTKTGTFDVDEITLKIGKEVYTWRLTGL